MHSWPSRADTRPEEGWDTPTAAACHWHRNTRAGRAQGSAVPDGGRGRETARWHEGTPPPGCRPGQAPQIQQAPFPVGMPTKVGRKSKFCSVLRWHAASPGQALPGSSWGTQAISYPNDGHNIKHAKSVAPPRTSSSPALTPGGTREAPAAEHRPARCPTKEVSRGRDEPNRLKICYPVSQGCLKHPCCQERCISSWP